MNPAQKMSIQLDHKARRSGKNWICRCPAHNDHTPSLAISYQNSRMVYHCHAGCDFDSIAAAIRSRGYNPFNAEPDSGWRPGDPAEKKRKTEKTRPKKPEKSKEQIENELFLANFTYDPELNPWWAENPLAKPEIPYGYQNTTYTYRSPKRDDIAITYALLFRRDKIIPDIPGEKKRFLVLTPWRKNTTGKLHYIPRPPPEPFPIYGHDTIDRPGMTWILEGEKCRDIFDKFIGHSMPVLSYYTGNPGHADNTPLKDKYTIIITDLDKKGEINGEIATKIIGKKALAIKSPYRVQNNEKPPKGWDIGDEIEPDPQSNRKPYTIEEFIRYLLRQISPDDKRTKIIIFNAIRNLNMAREQKNIP